MSSPTPEALRRELAVAVAQLRHAYVQPNLDRGIADGLIAPQVRRLESVLALLDAQDAPLASVSRAQVEALETEESIEWHCDVVRLRDVLALFASPPARDDAPVCKCGTEMVCPDIGCDANKLTASARDDAPAAGAQGTCATCRHWDRHLSFVGAPLDTGRCGAGVRQGGQATSGIYTSAAFGCTLHEPATPTPGAGGSR